MKSTSRPGLLDRLTFLVDHSVKKSFFYDILDTTLRHLGDKMGIKDKKPSTTTTTTTTKGAQTYEQNRNNGINNLTLDFFQNRSQISATD